GTEPPPPSTSASSPGRRSNGWALTDLDLGVDTSTSTGEIVVTMTTTVARRRCTSHAAHSNDSWERATSTRRRSDRQRALASPSCTRGVVRQAVADEAHCLDGVAAEGLVDPLSKVADVDLDDVGVSLEAVVPHVLEDLGLGDDVAGLAHQVLEEGELTGGESDLDLAHPAPVGGGVEAQVADVEDRGPFPPAPAQQRPDPGHQHHVGEWFGQEVVGPGVERLDLVELAVLGGEHDDRRPVVRLPERRAHLVAVHAR